MTRPFLCPAAQASDSIYRRDDALATSASICVVGTVTDSDGSFLWSWANDSLPQGARKGIEQVQEFGRANDLSLLFEPCCTGGHPQAQELLAISGRILDSAGTFFDKTDGVGIYFLLSDFQPAL